MADIPEEAVERARDEHYGDGRIGPWFSYELGRERMRAALRASGALFLTTEEKRALLGVTETTTGFVSGRLGRNLTEEFRSARQKLEESL